MATYRRMLKDKNGNNIIPVTSDPETAGLVYMGYAGFNKRTYNNGYLALENLTNLFSGTGVSVVISSNALRLDLTLPTTGSYVAEVYAQLWVSDNTYNYQMMELHKNENSFARVMAYQPINNSWGFIELTHPVQVVNGDRIEAYLNTSGHNFSDGNMSSRDSYIYLKIYKVA